MTRRRVILVLGVVGILTVLYLGWGFLVGLERAAYLSFLSKRQECLKELGKRILDYTEKDEGTLPESLDEMLALGIVTADDLVTESIRGIRVSRQFRPVPQMHYLSKLLLLIERYDVPYHDNTNVLTLGGRVYCVHERDVKEDDELRRAHGLPPV